VLRLHPGCLTMLAFLLARAVLGFLSMLNGYMPGGFARRCSLQFGGAGTNAEAHTPSDRLLICEQPGKTKLRTGLRSVARELDSADAWTCSALP